MTTPITPMSAEATVNELSTLFDPESRYDESDKEAIRRILASHLAYVQRRLPFYPDAPISVTLEMSGRILARKECWDVIQSEIDELTKQI